jgi:hypothetical protein
VSQNDLNLYQQQIRAREKAIRLANTSLIDRYATKSSKLMRHAGTKPEDTETQHHLGKNHMKEISNDEDLDTPW